MPLAGESSSKKGVIQSLLLAYLDLTLFLLDLLTNLYLKWDASKKTE